MLLSFLKSLKDKLGLTRKIYNRFLSAKKEKVKLLRDLLGFTPNNIAMYEMAFRHSSTSTDARGNNERLEFLGDAVLDTIISEYLFKKYPLRKEGFLTQLRAKIVNRKRLKILAGKIDLQSFMVYKKNVKIPDTNILGNALEALIGAIYLDAGYENTQEFVLEKLIRPYINLEEIILSDINYKSRLLEWAQKDGKILHFEVLNEVMDGKNKLFVVGAFIDSKQKGKGKGRSKKVAEKEAARMACKRLNIGMDELTNLQ